MSTLAKKRTSPQIQEAAKLMGIGIIQQQSGNYEMSKANMTAGIEKIKQSLISDSMIDREMILNYYSLFEKFLLNCSNQQEIEKNNSEIKLSLLELQDNISNPQETFKDIYDDYIKFKMANSFSNESNSIELFNFTNKILTFFAKSFDSGFYLTKDTYLRKEIFMQMNAKIELLHQKYETYKILNDKIDNLLIFLKQNAITNENISKFCYIINDIQNNFSKETKSIPPTHFPVNNDPSTTSLLKRFTDISKKIKSNLLSIKLDSIPDYFSTLSTLCRKFKEFENILNISNYRTKPSKELLINKRIEICHFFYHTIIRWTFTDIRDLALRFLQKKIMFFEQKVEFK